MIASSPPPTPAGRPPQHRAGTWGPYSISGGGACLSDFAAAIVVLVCFSLVALCLHCAARFLLRCLDRRRAAREEEEEEAQQQEPKPASDADGGVDGASGNSPVATAGVWAEADCAICLYQLQDPEGGGQPIRVLPACGHGFHAACVGAWLATHASCPTCRAPARARSRSRSQPSRTTTRQP